jgi:hypothetical protein
VIFGVTTDANSETIYRISNLSEQNLTDLSQIPEQFCSEHVKPLQTARVCVKKVANSCAFSFFDS